MQVEFYKTIDEKNKINKTLSTALLVDCKLLDSTNILNPTITISGNNKTAYLNNDFNYCYIPKLNRYYFINNSVIVQNNIVALGLTVDVLMTYRQSILNSYAHIIKSQNPNQDKLNHSMCDKISTIEYDYNDIFDHTGKIYLTSTYGIRQG